MKGWRTLVVAAAVAATLGAPRAVRAEDYPNQAGWGVLAVLANVGYMPAKMIYALTGGLTGGSSTDPNADVALINPNAPGGSRQRTGPSPAGQRASR